MRRLYLSGTLVFWLLIAALWGAKFWLPEADAPAIAVHERPVSPAELSRHAVPDDCWMAIRGSVYDVSPYLPEHPSRPEFVLPWCGRDASEAYATKSKGRPHSAQADELLAKYRLGSLAAQ